MMLPSAESPQAAFVIFDIDGTLFETQRVTVPAVQRTFAAYGLPEPETARICATFGRPVEEYLAWLASLCPSVRADEIVEAVNELEIELIEREGRLYPGIIEMLDALRKDGHVLGVCSNGPDDYVTEFLRAYDLTTRFAIVRARGTRYPGKEEMLGEMLDIVAARPAIMVGDRWDDVSAAQANGALAIGALYGFGGSEELQAADALVTRPAEIVPVVRRLATAVS